MKEDKKEEKKVIGGKYTIYLNEELGRGTFAVTYAAKFKNPPHTQFACKMIVKNHI